MSKIAHSKAGLIISLLLLVIFPAMAEGVTTFLTEGFEGDFTGGAPSGWTASYKTGTVDWVQSVGDFMNDDGPHSGSFNALLFSGDWTSDHETYLITPAIDFGTDTNIATLEFYHKQRKGYSGHQDTLKVYYKRSETSPWIPLASYASDVETWTKRTITLPNLSSAYYIGFLGDAKYGFGVCIDDVRVYADSNDGGGSDGTTNYYAVISGVSNYQSVSDLLYCDDDAIDVRNALLAMGNWKSENITMLTDSDATKAAIQSAISDMAGKAEANDLCLFYFSGHGSSEGTDAYLLPYDSLTDSYDNDIRDDELGAWFGALPTNEYVVLLDTCFSGGQIRGLIADKNAGMGKGLVKGQGGIAPQNGGGFTTGFLAGYTEARAGIKLTTKSGVQTKDLKDNGRGVVVTACAAAESSYETDALQNGVFTYYLVNGMAGAADTDGDKSISAEECYAYVRPRATTYTSNSSFSDGPQHAQMYDAWPGELEMGISDPIITKCTVKAGKRPIVAAAADSITVRGELGATASDFENAMNTDISVTIDSNDMNDPCVITFPVDGNTFRNGKFSYSKTINGLKKSFKYDTKTHVFNFSANKINLSGLNCPLTVIVEIGDYIATLETYESMVNGTRPIPINLLMGVKDSLRVDKITVKQNTTKPASDKLTVKGGFSAWDANVNMAETDVNVILGTQMWTIPDGNFIAKKTKFTCSKKATENQSGIATASFDFSTGAFTLAIKNTDIDDVHGLTNFEINFGDVNATTDVNLP